MLYIDGVGNFWVFIMYFCVALTYGTLEFWKFVDEFRGEVSFAEEGGAFSFFCVADGEEFLEGGGVCD